MVGIVIVSHSETLAAGVRELAAEMAGPDVRVELAGGLAEEGALATLGIRQGHAILVTAHGPQAAAALAALAELAERDFDEQAAPVPSEAPPAPATSPDDGQALTGLPGAPGIVFAPARYFHPLDPEIPTRSSGDPEAEWDALTRALEQVRAEIRAARDSVPARAGEYSAAIFDAHLLFLDDEALLEPARRTIFEAGKNAAEAWHEAAEAIATDYRGLDDEYMQARAADLTGVARQVVAALAGKTAPSLSAPGIVVAGD